MDRFAALNPYDTAMVPGSILNIVEEINFDSEGKQPQVYGYGISAKRYALYVWEGARLQIIKASEHGLGLYDRPKCTHLGKSMPYRDPAKRAAWMREYRKRKRVGQMGLPASPPSTLFLLRAPDPPPISRQTSERSSPQTTPPKTGSVRKGARSNFRTALELARTFPWGPRVPSMPLLLQHRLQFAGHTLQLLSERKKMRNDGAVIQRFVFASVRQATSLDFGKCDANH